MLNVPPDPPLPAMPAVPSQPPTPAAAPAAVSRPSVAPNPPGRRLALLLKLFLVPAAVVCLPTLFVSYFFGQRPGPKKAPDAAFTGLRDSLERAARERLPEGGTTFGTRFEDLSLPCPPAAAEARLALLRAAAERGGGTVTDQAEDADGRHLLVELPEANLPRFRREAALAAAISAPPGAEATAAPAAGDRVFLRLTLVPVLAPPAP